jgi:hypothetical protein
MFHASKWGDISLNNPLEIKKFKKIFGSGRACQAQIGRGRALPIWLAF